VWSKYNELVSKFGDEYSVLIDASKEAMAAVVEPQLAETIVKVREGALKVTPGYDGVYGQLVLDAPTLPQLQVKPPIKRVQQLNMSDFW
jgi:PHP family Zn ribbon phosphoesterase